MDFPLLIQKILKLEDEDDIDNICFNLILKDGIEYSFCFFLDEDDDYLYIVSTDAIGRERGRIIKKRHIMSVEIVYDDEFFFNDEIKDKTNERMFIWRIH